MVGPRVLHLADLHISLSGPRRSECVRIINWIASNAREVHPDVIVLAGDLFDRRSTPPERIFFAEFLRELSSVAPVVAINGNHDDRDDLKLFRAEYGWQMPVDIATEPTVITRGGVGLALLPWPDLGKFAAADKGGASIAVRIEEARAGLLDVVRGFRLNPLIGLGKPSLLIAHLPITGASMDSGQPVASGNEISLTADELLEGESAGVLAGHIHLSQQMRGMNGIPVWYAGAPFRCSFGEAKGEKGGLIWDWQGKSWVVTTWEVPARRMVLLEAKWAEGQLSGFDGHEPLAGAEVRLRIEFPREDREAVRARTEEIKTQLEAEGAISVTIDERPIVITRSRCVEITAARTIADKIIAWAKSAGLTIPAGALDKLKSLAAEGRS